MSNSEQINTKTERENNIQMVKNVKGFPFAIDASSPFFTFLILHYSLLITHYNHLFFHWKNK